MRAFTPDATTSLYFLSKDNLMNRPIKVIIRLLEYLFNLFDREVKCLSTIEKVKKIEEEAKQLEKSFDDKVIEMEKNTEMKISEIKATIEQDLAEFQNKQDEERNKKLSELEEQLAEETAQEIQYLQKVYEKNGDKLVDVVIEEVIKQYGNS